MEPKTRYQHHGPIMLSFLLFRCFTLLLSFSNYMWIVIDYIWVLELTFAHFDYFNMTTFNPTLHLVVLSFPRILLIRIFENVHLSNPFSIGKKKKRFLFSLLTYTWFPYFLPTSNPNIINTIQQHSHWIPSFLDLSFHTRQNIRSKCYWHMMEGDYF